MIRIGISVLIIFYAFYALGQHPVFISPLNIPLRLAGNFGEPRQDHFHSGLDIKTNYTTGLPVKAIADGYISRINISPKGYGKALYINHSNGITSVYAHLKGFNPTIDSLVNYLQIKHKRFRLDYSLNPNTILVKQSQIVAYSGNSGSSTAPHLHFETRETINQYPINPLKFFSIDDQIAPRINAITIYPLSNKSWINGTSKKKTFLTSRKRNQYSIQNPIHVKGPIGISVSTYDQQGKDLNKNGVYNIALIDEKDTVFSYCFNQFGFKHKRYVNALIDYSDFMLKKRFSLKCFYPKHINLPIYKTYYPDSGKIVLSSSSKTCQVIVSDYNSNTSNCTIRFIQDTNNYNPIFTKNIIMYYNQPFNFSNSAISVIIDPYALYKNHLFEYKTSNIIKHTGFLTHHIGSMTIPLQRYCRFSIIPEKPIAPSLHDKIMVVRLNKKKKLDVYKPIKVNHAVVFETREFGPYSIFIDTISPSIKPLNYSKDMSHKVALNIESIDNLSKLNTYNGYINGKWVVVEYDQKNNLLSHRFRTFSKEKKVYTFKLEVTDRSNNKSSTTLNFKR